MSHNTFELRNRLVKDAGMTPEQAETFLDVMQEQNRTTAASKADLADFKIELLGKLYAALAAQTLATVALIVTLIKVLH